MPNSPSIYLYGLAPIDQSQLDCTTPLATEPLTAPWDWPLTTRGVADCWWTAHRFLTVFCFSRRQDTVHNQALYATGEPNRHATEPTMSKSGKDTKPSAFSATGYLQT